MNGEQNGQVDKVLRTKNMLGQANMFRLTRLIEGMGEQEVLAMTREDILGIARKNFDFEMTLMNIRGALKILGWRTNPKKCAKEGNGRSKVRNSLAMNFHYLKKNVAEMRQEMAALSTQVKELISKLS